MKQSLTDKIGSMLNKDSKVVENTTERENPVSKQAELKQGEREDYAKNNLKILPELREYIPPLSDEEFTLLEASIVKEGCRDFLIAWKNPEDQYILIDGHNRHKICQLHQVDYRLSIKEFNDIDEVKIWMISNQLGKRNMSEEAKSYLRGKQYQNEKKKEKFRGNQFTKTIIAPLIPDNEEDKILEKSNQAHVRIANQHKVSPKTIQRDEKYAIGLDKLTNGDEDMRWKILQKTIILPKKFVETIPEKSDAEIATIRKDIVEGKKIIHQQAKINTMLIDTTEQDFMSENNDAMWNEWASSLTKSFQEVQKNKDISALKKMKKILQEIEKLFS